MIQGIAVFGLNGSGKSTLAHALAKQTGYFEMDAEDYYFPEQRKSRIWALENPGMIDTAILDELPFSAPRTKQEVQTAIIADINAHPKFVLSSVTMNWSDEIVSHIDIAFWIQAPLEERLRRIQMREEKRFGARVLAGGDMFPQQIEFRKAVENRDLKSVEESARRLNCPVIPIDGALSAVQILDEVMEHLNMIL